MLLKQKVIVKWNVNNYKWYELFGYVFTKKNEEFEIDISELKKGSHIDVWVQCDYCGKKYLKNYKNYNKQNSGGIIHTDACNECKGIKTKESNLKIHGVESVNQLKEVRDKIENTNMEKYGTKCSLQNKKVAKKSMKTMIDKYGTIFPSQNKEIASKQKISLYKNKTAPCSQNQYYAWKVIGGELNYPFGHLNLDIALVDEKIDIEMDLGGHKLQVVFGNISETDFKKKETARDNFLQRRGWKIIRIISTNNDRLPSDGKLLGTIEYAKQYLDLGHSWINFDIDSLKVINANGIQDYNYGKLRKIYKKDIEKIDSEEAV